jgi:hypothetical protein
MVLPLTNALGCAHHKPGSNGGASDPSTSVLSHPAPIVINN